MHARPPARRRSRPAAPGLVLRPARRHRTIRGHATAHRRPAARLRPSGWLAAPPSVEARDPVTMRDTRLQAAIVRDDHLLLVQCTLPGEPPFWVLPGGGREAGESDAEAVAREVREELGVEVEVGRLVDDVPADPPDGTYTRWRTFACRVVRGEPAACGADGAAVLTAVRWLPLAACAEWDAALRSDRFLYPQLVRVRAALGTPAAAADRDAG